MADQKKWLNKALENEWAVSELRINMRKSMAEYQNDDEEIGAKSFNLMSWTQEGIRWLKSESRKAPIDQWSEDRKRLIKKDLEPIVEIYNKL